MIKPLQVELRHVPDGARHASRPNTHLYERQLLPARNEPRMGPMLIKVWIPKHLLPKGSRPPGRIVVGLWVDGLNTPLLEEQSL